MSDKGWKNLRVLLGIEGWFWISNTLAAGYLQPLVLSYSCLNILFHGCPSSSIEPGYNPKSRYLDTSIQLWLRRRIRFFFCAKSNVLLFEVEHYLSTISLLLFLFWFLILCNLISVVIIYNIFIYRNNRFLYKKEINNSFISFLDTTFNFFK